MPPVKDSYWTLDALIKHVKERPAIPCFIHPEDENKLFRSIQTVLERVKRITAPRKRRTQKALVEYLKTGEEF
jgi:hypothetical protein